MFKNKLTTTVLLFASLTSVAAAETKLDIRLDTAGYVIHEFQRLPEQGIPEALLRNAAGIAVIPNVLKVGFAVGGRFGRGVLLIRGDDGRFAPPVFVTLGSGSFGWQIGAQSADLVLVFRDADTVRRITGAKFTLGADASIAAGPVGRYTSAATDIKFDAEVYSYSRTKGLFAGVALDGAVLSLNRSENEVYYTKPGADLRSVSALSASTIPASARRLLATLDPYVQATGTETVRAGLPDEPGATPAVRTFGLGEQPLDDDRGASDEEHEPEPHD